MSTLVLDTVTFTVDEVPERITLGGEQATAIHRYAGGQLDVQTLGAFDELIEWDGVLQFQNALTRVQALNALRIAGTPVTLQIGGMSCSVVVTFFKWTYQNDFYVPYMIRLQPLGLILFTQSPNTSANQTTTPVAAPALSTATQLADTPTQIANANTTPVQYPVTTLFGSANDTTAAAMLDIVAPVPNVPTPNPSPQVYHTVGVADTLWSIAAAYYNDGTQWSTIAAANSLVDPIPAVGTKLLIPNPVNMVSIS